ncbi:DUF7683 domain-containing protein [Photobacterium alginatilyticum]|uniref:DUF7683 domain-containing protein n=1 Tax=Photobacterium alginatilyticum TaxID=1775171 RepID=UPI00196452CF|nr:hypothetical protein [Photobacterium alginatilyticum]
MIQRFVRWYDKEEGSFVGEEPFYLRTEELQSIFGLASHNPLFDCYKIEATMISEFTRVLLLQFDFEKYDYFVESEESQGLVHELWIESDIEQTFCLAEEKGNSAKSLLSPKAKLTWTVSATSHYEAMEKYYQYMGWGHYSSEFLDDRLPYAIES